MYEYEYVHVQYFYFEAIFSIVTLRKMAPDTDSTENGNTAGNGDKKKFESVLESIDRMEHYTATKIRLAFTEQYYRTVLLNF